MNWGTELRKFPKHGKRKGRLRDTGEEAASSEGDDGGELSRTDERQLLLQKFLRKPASPQQGMYSKTEYQKKSAENQS